ncbi:MAG: hypothetical protein ACO1NZ_05055 [Adhaeribacter sp.]
MKKIFTSAVFCLALFAAQAQTTEPGPDQLKAQATEQTRVLAQKIGLNELEYIKIKNYTLQKLIAAQEVNQMYSNDAEMRAKKLAAIEEEYTKNLMATLTPKQHLNYTAMNSQK